MNDPFLADFYKNHIENTLIPFWTKALDHRYGGVFTCFNNQGNRLISKDKYTWSQGRFLWVWSRIARLVADNTLTGDGAAYKAHLEKTAAFLEQHVFLENGNCAYRLSETGIKLESRPGAGYDTSIYADCFIAMGLAEYAGLTVDLSRFERALGLYHRIRERIAEGYIRSEPYPVPDGYRAHGIEMIMLNVSQGLADVARDLRYGEEAVLLQDSVGYMGEIMQNFCVENYRLIEMLPEDPADKTSLLYRHVNPGHTMESMWFVMHTAVKTGRHDLVEAAAQVTGNTFDLGWDREYGGLFRFVDEKGGLPGGERKNTPVEEMISGSWDTKLWWVHSEALYATLLAFKLTGRSDLKSRFEQVHEYAFSTFPNPDNATGEWIQIRDRRGRPFNKVVALPVKDPFHILRNMLLLTELLTREG